MVNVVLSHLIASLNSVDSSSAVVQFGWVRFHQVHG